MSIGERLREERERLGFTQPAFAGLAETTKKSQIDYEKDLTQPKAGYLAAIGKVGADVQYIVMGTRSASSLTQDEDELLKRYRVVSLELKAAAIGALTAGAEPIKHNPKFAINYANATIGQHNTVTGGNHTFEVSMPRGKKK